MAAEFRKASDLLLHPQCALMSDRVEMSILSTLPDWRTVVTLLDDSAVAHSEDGFAFTFQDALVAAPTGDGKYLITSPNMDYIPAPAWGQLNVTLKADGKCGMEDPIQWPQICIEDSRWASLACIRRPHCGSRGHQHWRLPTRGELDAPGGLVRAVEGAHGLYTLSKARLQPLREMLKSSSDDIEVFESSKGSSSYLRWLQLNAKNALDCLEVPATERDIVRQLVVAERFWCMISAWLTYNDLFCNLTATSAPREVDRTFMGCFTTSPRVVGEFYHAGVPVWYMRLMHTLTPAIRVRSITTLQLPENIVVTSGLFGSRPVYQGPPGKAQLEAIIFGSNQYIDIEPLPFPASYTSNNAARDAGRAVAPLLGQTSGASSSAGPSRITTSSKKKKKQAKKQKAIPYHRPALPQSDPHTINKFGDPSSEFIPPLLDGWQAALNHGVNEVKPTSDSWQLWVPEPHMVCGSSSADRRRRYILNWLRLREVWWTNLRDPNSRKCMMSRWWRAFLDDGFEPSRGDHEAVRQKALAVITSLSGYSASDPVALRPTWFGQLVTTVDTALCQQVAWEISEMGFRVELVLLDLVFLRAEAKETKIQSSVAAERQLLLNQIFPATNPLCISSFPTTDTGLASPNAAERRPCVEAMRCLMKSWPGCPSPLCDCASLEHAADDALVTAEFLIKKFYVETFVKVANRPPILPRRRPAISPLLHPVPGGSQPAQPTPPPPPPPSAESPPSTPPPPSSPLSLLPPSLPFMPPSSSPSSPSTDFLSAPTPIAGRGALSVPSNRSHSPVSLITSPFARTRSSSPISQDMLEYREVTPCPPTPPRLGSESPPSFFSLNYSTPF